MSSSTTNIRRACTTILIFFGICPSLARSFLSLPLHPFYLWNLNCLCKDTVRRNSCETQSQFLHMMFAFFLQPMAFCDNFLWLKWLGRTRKTQPRPLHPSRLQVPLSVAPLLAFILFKIREQGKSLSWEEQTMDPWHFGH